MENHAQNLEYEEASASSKPINLELVFRTRVASPVYTGKTIIGEVGGTGENEPINIMLVDSDTHQRVTNGGAASLKVKIVLIRADFVSVNEVEGFWTSLEFKNNIVVDFQKKKNLLIGDLSLVLKDGSGTLGEIRIKHDSNPLRNVKFRLGAMVDGDFPYAIKEAITYPFDVKDRRNESKNIGPLLLDDVVWKLVNIAKKGPIRKRLEKNNVWTVRLFLNMYSSNPEGLKAICGLKGKKWEKTVSHAKTSLIDYDVRNGYGRVGSTSHQSNSIPSVDYDHNFEFDYNCYMPQLCENDSIDNMLTEDSDFSIDEVEVSDVCFLGLERYENHQEDRTNDALAINTNEGGMAKKRWMKLRDTLSSLMETHIEG